MKNTTLNKYLALIVIFFCALTFGYGQSDIIISQYIETNTGTTPKGIEIYNVSGADITFTALNNLQIFQGTNGAACVNLPGTNLITGTLLDGETWVIGTTNLTAYANSNGVNISGTSDYNFAFNGNDALQLYLGGVLQDEFGICGIDPGASWVAGGVNTMDNNLQLINGLCDGDIDGWIDPSERFNQVADGVTMTGFGNAPTSCTKCASTVTWDGANWSAPPGNTTSAIINGAYSTTTNGNLSVCSLTINPTFRLTVNNSTYIEVVNDVIVDGELYVETQGNFVQNDDAGAFTNNGISLVNKTTALKQAWYYYTYWSSPVVGETIAGAFPDTDTNRRFSFNASNYLDIDGDDIDDDNNDWTVEAGGNTMTPGIGYAATSSQLGFYPSTDIASFNGPFNTGDITTGIVYNAANLNSWNLIGNPYPSAIDFIAFQTANSTVVDGVAYFWSQFTPPDSGTAGNFSQNDYATYTVGTGGAAGASGVTPNQYIPSGQSFFIVGSANGNVTFTNAMRMADITSNGQFFRIAQKNKSKAKTVSNNENRLWIDLTSDNGVYNQILIGYVEYATNQNDGLNYDAPRNLSAGFTATLYSKMNESNDKFVIQGKSINSLNEDEVINLGFSTIINDPTIYTLSIAQLEGDFLNNNVIYVKDNFLNTLHDLKTSDYNFTSEAGEFNERFEIVFNSEALSTDEHIVKNNALSIIEHQNGDVQFKLSGSLAMSSIQIIDLQGRELYKLNANGKSETYSLSNLSQAPYIAKVTLVDGYVITKKAIKRY